MDAEKKRLVKMQELLKLVEQAQKESLQFFEEFNLTWTRLPKPSESWMRSVQEGLIKLTSNGRHLRTSKIFLPTSPSNSSA
jgi:hypothetical protein